MTEVPPINFGEPIGDLSELTQYITGDTKHAAIPDLAPEIAGPRVARAADRVQTAGVFDQDDIFHGRRSGASDIAPALESHETLRDQIAELKAEGLKTDRFEKLAGKQKDEITKKARKVFRDLGESGERNKVVLDTLNAEHVKLQDKLNKTFTREYERLQKSINPNNVVQVREQLENLRHNHEAVLAKVETHFEGLRIPHEEHASRLAELVGDLEKETGLKASEFMPNKAVASLGTTASKIEKGIIGAAYEDKSFIGKGIAAGKANWNQAQFGKTRVVLGAIIGIPLAVSGISDTLTGIGLKSAGKDERGQELPADGKLFTGLAKLGGAALATVLAVKGGASRAMGRA